MSLLFPFLAQILLTLGVAGVLAVTRFRAVSQRQVKIRDIAVSNDTWPAKARLVGNNFANQFETPVLFYALVLMAMQVGATGSGMVTCAWLYVAARIVHAAIHMTSNAINLRFAAFLAGVAALAAMLIQLAMKALA